MEFPGTKPPSAFFVWTTPGPGCVLFSSTCLETGVVFSDTIGLKVCLHFLHNVNNTVCSNIFKRIMVPEWRNRGSRLQLLTSCPPSCPSPCSPNCLRHLCPVFQLSCVLKEPFAAPHSLLTQRGMSNVTGGGSYWSVGPTSKILINLLLYSIFSLAVTGGGYLHTGHVQMSMSKAVPCFVKKMMVYYLRSKMMQAK